MKRQFFLGTSLFLCLIMLCSCNFNSKQKPAQKEATLVGITITKNPSKTAYLQNDTFDPTGMEVTAYYHDGKTAVIDNSKVTTDFADKVKEPSPSAAVTVSYQKDLNTFYGTFDISVEYKFHETIEILPAGTDGAAGTKKTYAIFGDYPQTIKPNDVTVNTNEATAVFKTFGGKKYYRGSDYFYYTERTDNIYYGTSETTYSNGTIAQWDVSNTNWFRIEPIKWSVASEDENYLTLEAEKVLYSEKYYLNSNKREIKTESSTTYIQPQNYSWSTLYASLVGSYKDGDTQSKTYSNNGFKQNAFTSEAYSKISVYKPSSTTTYDGYTDYCISTGIYQLTNNGKPSCYRWTGEIYNYGNYSGAQTDVFYLDETNVEKTMNAANSGVGIIPWIKVSK